MTTFVGTVTATDGSLQTAQVTVQFNSVPPLTVTASVSPASGPPGTLYTITAVAAGGTPPYSYSIGPINGIQPQPMTGQPGVFTITL